MKCLLAFALSLAACSVGVAQAPAHSDAPAGAIFGVGVNGKPVLLPDRPALDASVLYILQPDVNVTESGGQARLVSRADFLGLSPLPVLETAIVLNKPDGVALDVTLSRGRIEVRNLVKAPTAVRLRFAKQSWKLTLGGDAKVALEVSGRWPAGAEFRAKPVEGYGPTMSAVLLQLEGTSSVSTGTTTFGLGAPPGPALVTWTSLEAGDPVPTRLDKLPDWADPTHRHPEPLAARLKGVGAAVAKFRTLRNEKPDTALDTFLTSADADERRIGLVVAGAGDDLLRLADGITEAKDAETWDFGITVLRHWLGRGPGQEQKFHRFLLDERKYTAADAAKLFRLLTGFTPREQARPELYDVLIEYLRHDRAAFRNLAAWHLTRLAPDVPNIPFKTNGSKSDFEPVYTMWRAAIPAGTTPRESVK